ncbi:MAG TPA: ferredoxin reductase [Baekduia sp.]|nr:ferredoxin reductase [Baekduia sp.]
MVERAATPRVPALRKALLRAARAMTTPLAPDDYLALIDPRWSTRELTGSVVRVVPETEDAATVVIKPSFPWPGHRPGQYLRIGAERNGIRHWRAYSLTSDPDHPEGYVSITVKHVPEGLMSPFFTRGVQPGQLVFLGEVEGQFVLPEPRPRKLLMISAGSGITPVFAMLRQLEREAALHDVVHLHGTRTAEDFIFGARLRDLAARQDGYRLREQISSQDGRLVATDLDELVPDWRERHAFLSGPREMIDAFQEHWEAEGVADQLETERFQPVIGTGTADVGSGGTVRFRVTDVEATCDVGVSILVGGEEAGALLPYGCRMGICHTCVGKLCCGSVRDLRTGEIFSEQGQTIRTCVNAPEGHVEIEL